METENIQDIGTEEYLINNLIVEDYDSPEEIEFRRKLENPFHLFEKGDYWVASEIFCLNCGGNTYPLIFDKLIIEKSEIFITTFSKDELGRKIPRKSKPAVVYKYCEILQCNHEKCRELFFRTYSIFEDRNQPEDEPRIIPIRKDKIPINNESENEAFEKAFNRYVEAVMAYNMDLNYCAGVATRSVLEIICKIRGHFDAKLENEVGDRTLPPERLDAIKRRIGLEPQMDLLIPEIQSIAPGTFDAQELANIKLMMFWGHGVVHGGTDPSPEEIKSGLEILEEIFRLLYFDKEEDERRTDVRNRRRDDLSRNNQNFRGYARR